MSKHYYTEKPCDVCGKAIYTRKDKPSKTCSTECLAELYKIKCGLNKVCAYCGEKFSTKKQATKFCSNKCSAGAKVGVARDDITGPNSYNWVGGESIKDGYKMVLIKKRLYQREHRVVMEKAIGRKLTEDEVVHHIDGNKTNNVIENLKIVSRSQHIEMHRDGLYVSRRARRAEREVRDATL